MLDERKAKINPRPPGPVNSPPACETARMSPESPTNAWCEALGIPVPRLEDARRSPDANTYSLLLAALLEHGTPLTLAAVARRFEEVGIAPADRALASLKRCKPGRPPIYREGDLYALDPHDAKTDPWVFRLGLRPARATPLRVVRPPPGPLPDPAVPLTAAALGEAWRHGLPGGWSGQRIAICVLDAHGDAMCPQDVLAFVRAHDRGNGLPLDPDRRWQRGAPIRVRDDGRWQLDRSHPAVRAAREAARDRVAAVRRRAETWPDPVVLEANIRRSERRRRAHGERLAGMRRALLHGFPTRRPEALVLVDVARREIATWQGDGIAAARERLADYEIIAAVGVRELLRALGFDPGTRRLAELGPPRKTRRLNKRGRSLRITTTMLVQGSCNVARPFGDEARLRAYLREGDHTRLRRRLEADARSLCAYYQYGRLHGAVRLRWGFLDEWVPAPWVHHDEPKLYDLMEQAHEQRRALEVVTGSAPGWADPWARARRAYVVEETSVWGMELVDEEGQPIDLAEVQLARVAERP